jgi:hypothetical protein
VTRIGEADLGRPIYKGDGPHGTGTCRPFGEMFSRPPFFF